MQGVEYGNDSAHGPCNPGARRHSAVMAGISSRLVDVNKLGLPCSRCVACRHHNTVQAGCMLGKQLLLPDRRVCNSCAQARKHSSSQPERATRQHDTGTDSDISKTHRNATRHDTYRVPGWCWCCCTQPMQAALATTNITQARVTGKEGPRLPTERCPAVRPNDVDSNQS